MTELSVDHRILLENACRDEAGEIEQGRMLRLYEDFTPERFVELAGELAEDELLELAEAAGTYRITARGREVWEGISKRKRAETRRSIRTWQP